MNALVLTFDSLNRHLLPPYGCRSVVAPNFERLARRATTFDRAYVGSMPCMPARREFHTGHGIMLGEHGCFAKNWQPWYEELSHMPFFVHDPRHPEADGQRRQALVQTIDLAPTLLRYFGQPIPPEQWARLGLGALS